MESFTLRPPGSPRDNLPLELSSFVGREREIAQIASLLCGDTRLLTLYGSGGAGKTRLALAAAQEVVEGFEDGVWWVELGSISDPKLVPLALATALGVREVPDRSLAESIAEYLGPRKSLVILDNCEHLVYGCAALADALLRACPYLKILATSREPLRVAGEAIWMVPSLSLPDPQRRPSSEQLASYEAIRLFVERAEEADASFSLSGANAAEVALLCRRLDGIPLAIELAAARVRALTVEQISERLENPLNLLTTGSRTAPPRHQTLRAALQWSYELLDEQERELFRRLSAFEGGWDLEAAEKIGADNPLQAGLVLDLLGRLMDKSLVLAQTNGEEDTSLRYRMLAPVRQFGREKLQESTETQDILRRHAEYYLYLAERADPELLGPDQARWLQRLRTELGNLRRALSWSIEPDQEERAEKRLRLVAALGRFWGREGFEEGKWWLQVALESDPGGFPAARAKALGELGFILLFQQSYGPAIVALEEAVALYKGLGDQSGAAFALGHLGWAALHGDYGERVPAFVEEGEALISGNADGPSRAYLRIVLASAALWKRDLDSAVSQLEESLALSRELGSLRDASMALFIWGMIELSRNDVERGVMLLADGARTTMELKDMLGASYYALALGKVEALRGRLIRAATLWGAAEAFREQMGVSLSHYDLTQSGYERDLILVRSTLDEASFEAARAEGRTMSHDQAFEFALEGPVSSDDENQVDLYPSGRRPGQRAEDDDGGKRRHNLPVTQGGFVGRERMIPEIKEIISKTQLLTLTGAGGCGKTRLALEMARDLVDDYPDGVWFVQLASLTDGDLVPGAVAAALGLREQPGLSFTQTLLEYLRTRRVLLIVDNCEHLIEVSARLADTLLSSCQHLHILATSREALGVAGEVNWTVPSLTVPDVGQLADLEKLARYEAVRLFVERARSRLPAFELTPEDAPAVVDICRKLDGIPLAIELAAARMGALAVQQIAGRLEDSLRFLTTGDRTGPPRQRTLRAALQWSYELLDGQEQELFGRLSVFAGGWDLEAAEAVGVEDASRAGLVLDLLSALVDKSLVVAEAEAKGTLRYRMLEPVRQYALECLVADGNARQARDRHGGFYLELAELATPELKGPQQVLWVEKLVFERDNLRAAMRWMLGRGEASTAARLGWALWLYWWIRGRFVEGRRWMEEALANPSLPERPRARALFVAGTMACGEADYTSAATLLEESLALFGELGDKEGTAYASSSAGFAAIGQGRHEEGIVLLEGAVTLSLEMGEKWGAAFMLCFMAVVRRDQEDADLAERLATQGLELSREIGDREGASMALYILGGIASASGERERAHGLFGEGLELATEVGDKTNVAYCLQGLAEVAASDGKVERAARLWGAAEALLEEIEAAAYIHAPDHTVHESRVAAARVNLGEQAFDAAWAQGRSMPLGQAIEYATEAPASADWTEKETRPPATAADVLRIYALGRARVEKDSIPVDSPEWTQKPRELLFYLLSYPEGRTKDQIGLALWPEASTSQLRSSFHDTVFRLRRALGTKEWVCYSKGRYSFGGSLSYSFDVRDFEGLLAEARGLRPGSPERAIARLREATELYRGDFLEDLAGGEWALERQEELRRSYQEALLVLGKLLREAGRHAEATDAFRGAIAHDRFLEEAHRGLMRSEALLGERGRALRHYEELVGMLEEQLGASPAHETTDLYERLRAGEEG